MNHHTSLTATAILAAAAILALAASSCTKSPPASRAPLARGEIPDSLRASFVRIELTPQSSEGENPPFSLSDEMRQKRPATIAGYLVAPDLVIAPDADIPPRFVREWRVRQAAAATVPAHPIAWDADRDAMLLKLDSPLPAPARPLDFVSPRPDEGNPSLALADYFAVKHDSSENWRVSIQPLSTSRWNISSAGERTHPVPANSIITTDDGTPVALVPDDNVRADGSWATPWRAWPWVYEADRDARLEKLSAATAAALIFVDIKLRPLPVRAGDSSTMMPTRTDDDPSTKPQPALVLSPRRVLVLAPLTPAYTARLENVTLRLPDNTAAAAGAAAPSDNPKSPIQNPKSPNARFIATLADYGAFIVEPERDIDAPLALPAAAPDWVALRDHLLLTIDLRLQGEARLARAGLTRVASAAPGWLGALTPRPADPSPTLFLFDLDGHLLGVPLAPRQTDTNDNSIFFMRMTQTSRATTVAASTLAAFTGDPADAKWADPTNIPVTEAEERQLVWLGADLQPLTRELAQAQGVSEQTQNGQSGGLVTKVYPDSPAARAGLKTGDVLLRMRRANETQTIPIRAVAPNTYAIQMLSNTAQQIPDAMFDRIPPPWPVADSPLNQKLKEIGANKNFEIDYARDGNFTTTNFTSEKGPAYYGTAPEATFASSGLNVKSLTFETRAFYKIPADKTALIVSRVVAGSRASVAGLRPYDLILEVNDRPVTTPADFAEQAKTAGKLRLLTRRMSQTRIVTLDIAAE